MIRITKILKPLMLFIMFCLIIVGHRVASYCKEGNVDYASRLFQNNSGVGDISHNVHCYTNLISALYKKGLVWFGLRPTVAIYSAIISSLGKHGRDSEAEETFAKMFDSDIQPDEIAYMIMINAYARNGRIGEANELVEEVVKNFYRPSPFTYTVLISGFVKTGMFKKGCEDLDKMLEDGLSPNVVLYTSLIGHFLKKGDYKFSFTLFGLMGENEIKHYHIAYITLLSGLWRPWPEREREPVWLALLWQQ